MSKYAARPPIYVLAIVFLLAPLVTALVSLAVGQSWSPAVFLFAGMAPPVGAFVLVWRWRMAVRALAQHVQQMITAPDLANRSVPMPWPDDVVELGVAVGQLQRVALKRQDRLAMRLESNELILDALPDPVILIATDRQVTRANHAARLLFGDRIAQRDLAATVRNPSVLEAVDSVLGGGGSRLVEFSSPVPVERVYEARIKPFVRPGGVGPDESADESAVRALLTLHDISAVKRSEQMRADFVANASHELRTPLSTLLGFIETLRGPARDDAEARDKFLSIMQDQAVRMSRLIADLLSLSRIELDENIPPTGTVDMVQNVRRSMAALELRATDRMIRLRVEAPDAVPPVLGDDDQLAQVLQNLVSNALTYSREHTDVIVRVTLADAAPVGGAISPLGGRLAPRGTSSGEMVAVSVTDRGDGIARTHLPRLTERFYRVDPARSRAAGGTGLGLAIVKHIVNRHRGRLTIESELGRGSVFTVYLPVAEGIGPAVVRAQADGAA